MAYQALPEGTIRVLQLAPGTFGSPLTGFLHTTSIENLLIWRRYCQAAYERQLLVNVRNMESGSKTHRLNVRQPAAAYVAGTGWPIHIDGYEAVSYTWGDPCLTHHLEIGCQSLLITESLYTLLQHLRYTDLPRRLWVDQICINQADLDERGNQVAMMADIFAAATKVLVWTGCGSADDALAFAVMQNGYGTSWSGTFDLNSLGSRLTRSPYCLCCKQNIRLTEIPGLDALKAIMKFIQCAAQYMRPCRQCLTHRNVHVNTRTRKLQRRTFSIRSPFRY